MSPCVPMGVIICWALCGSESSAYNITVSDRMKHKHQAVERIDNVHGPTVKRLCDRYHNQYTPPPAPVQEWKPKNPEITWPKMRKESHLTKVEWMKTDFPVNPLPKEVQGVINLELWKTKIQELQSLSPKVGTSLGPFST